MERTHGTTILVAATLVLGAIAGAGLVAAEDFPSATDGDPSNGEEIRSAEDDDDQAFAINYTFRPRNHRPGNENGYAEHYAEGLTENGTLHQVLLISEGMGFSDCTPGNTGAFGIDRGNDDPGTKTQFSLLSAFKSYNSGEDYINITFYREETLAGEPVEGTVYDQVVASQRDCYDNPSEPGWYRINGTITGNVAGGTETDYVIRDLSNYFYICDCDSRAEAEETLGPPPNESGDGRDGADDGEDSTGGETVTATATPADEDATMATPTATAAPADEEPATATATRTATATATQTAAAASAGENTPTATAASTDDSGAGTTATATAAQGTSGQQQGGASNQGQGDGPATPTVGDGPGFGAVVALLGALLATAALARRR